MRALHRIEQVQRLLEDQVLDAIIVRANSDLFWLTGFEDVFDSEQAHVAIITRQDCILHTDTRYVTAMREKAHEEGIWQIDASREREVEFIAHMLKELKLVTGRVAIDETMPLSLYRKYSDAMPNARFKERSDDILRLRAVKDADEIVLMKQAPGHRLGGVHGDVGGFTARHERARCLDHARVQHEAPGGERAGLREYRRNAVPTAPNPTHPVRASFEQGDFIVFDFGARVGGYCSDTTRTVCIGGASDEQIRVYEAVRRANEWVAASIKPGVTGAQMHTLAESELAKAGFEHKMGHSLGHGVGIDIHELPLLSPTNKEALVAGSVVTDEPGHLPTRRDGRAHRGLRCRHRDRVRELLRHHARTHGD